MSEEKGVTIMLPRLLPGLNGSEGLIRKSKFIKANADLKKSIYYQVFLQVPRLPKVQTPCRALLVRYHSGNPMDWDNAAASFKYLLDAIVKNGIIPDDNRKIITSITCEQHRIKGKADERMEVTFYPVYEESPDNPVVFL